MTKRRRSAPRASVTAQYALVAFVLAAALAAAGAALLKLDLVLAWLIAVTAVTFLAYGYDKAVAGTRRTRVPERVLLALTLAGGTLGALVAMPAFHHKTIKQEFRVRFWTVVVIQAALILVYFLGVSR
jgi:uncharacterized membrane protein YsdA (DUF1294 family)